MRHPIAACAAAAALVAGLASPVFGELYRWREPGGSLRYSNYPPPGYDPANPDPRVEVMPDPRVLEKKEPEAPAPRDRAAAGAGPGVGSGPPSREELLANRARLLRALLPHSGISDPALVPDGVRQQLSILATLRGLLNQVDPAGAPGRAREEEFQLGRLRNVPVSPAPLSSPSSPGVPPAAPPAASPSAFPTGPQVAPTQLPSLPAPSQGVPSSSAATAPAPALLQATPAPVR